jgi:hypothetical protein
MSNPVQTAPAEPPLSRPLRLVAVSAAAGLFLVLRLIQLVWRPHFFDELFTVWIARLRPGAMLEALASDSGPPLYYLLVRSLSAGEPSVLSARVISLAAASLLLASVVFSRRLGNSAVIAALLLAVFAPHVHFSTEARSYALAGALAGAGCLALAAWAGEGKRAPLLAGTALLVAAAASHYYGVLFFPIPFALGLLAWKKRRALEGALASAAAVVAFIPGVLLALRQPPESIAWMRLLERAPAPLDPVRQLAVVADYPAVFVEPPPEWLQLAALALTIAVVAAGARSAEARRWGVITLVPVALAVGSAAFGRNVYFPMRFESLLAAPFVCWLAVSLHGIPRRAIRGALTILLLAGGLVSSYLGIMTSLAKRPDPWRDAASFVQRTIPESIPIVASGYAYLEVLGQRDPAWDPPVHGFPREIETHPGWIADARRAPPALEELPPLPFVWIGEGSSAEHRALAGAYRLRPLLAGRGILVAEATEKP